VLASDAYGNASAFKVGPSWQGPVLHQDAQATFTGSWTVTNASADSGGSLHQTTQNGAAASFTFTGKGIALMSPDVPGSLTVSVDGVPAKSYETKIALEGGREEARGIFKQIDDELRRKTRELRPAMLGRATLVEAIEREFRRLANAGICAKFVHTGVDHENEISRPVQQLCFQVVREALSNAIRHARAKSVEVRLERTGASARISVIDDGRGIESSSNGEGTGLSGMRERLELMGGSLTIQSRAGRTTIMAEIPELS